VDRTLSWLAGAHNPDATERTLAEIDKTAKGLQARKGWEQAAAGLRKTAAEIRANRTEVCNDCLR